MYIFSYFDSVLILYNFKKVNDLSLLMEQMKKNVEEYYKQYGQVSPYTFFKYIVECVCAVMLALQKENGHILMIGFASNGRYTVLHLSAIILDYKITKVNFQNFLYTHFSF